jgi:hypothetical protein
MKKCDLLFLACMLQSCGPDFIRCTNQERAANGLEIAVNEFTETASLLSWMQVICEEEKTIKINDDFVHCYVEWYGNGPYRPRIVVEDIIEAECIIHESMHIDLYHRTKNACHSHNSSCGWNADKIEQLNSQLP